MGLKIQKKEEEEKNPILGKEILQRTPKTYYVKGKFQKLDFIKIENFCSGKDPAKRMKKTIHD